MLDQGLTEPTSTYYIPFSSDGRDRRRVTTGIVEDDVMLQKSE